jgi:H+-transporting ATPase
VAVLSTQAFATLIAVYGVFMTPLGWKWALFVWGYALAWFMVNDRAKLLTYYILSKEKAEAKPEPAQPASTGSLTAQVAA